MIPHSEIEAACAQAITLGCGVTVDYSDPATVESVVVDLSVPPFTLRERKPWLGALEEEEE